MGYTVCWAKLGQRRDVMCEGGGGGGGEEKGGLKASEGEEGMEGGREGGRDRARPRARESLSPNGDFAFTIHEAHASNELPRP